MFLAKVLTTLTATKRDALLMVGNCGLLCGGVVSWGVAWCGVVWCLVMLFWGLVWVQDVKEKR